MRKPISVVLIFATIISMLCIAFVPASAVSSDGLPDAVDNSESKYFPPVLSQGDQGSCVAWAQAYYQFSYEMNKMLDRESTKENCFSPSFLYNMSNYGEDVGCFPVNAYGNMKKIGVATFSTIPYNKEDCRDWFAQESIWQEAAKYRIADYKVLPNFRTGTGRQVTEPDDPDLTQIKTLLSEGHVLAFGAYIYRWKLSTIKENSACPENLKFVGEEVITATSPDIGTGYGHRMTLVGYNDNIWVDVNGNNTVDSGEMGAFKVANSFGTWWKNDGFIWLAYDNINYGSSVSGLSYRTMSGIVDVTSITVLPYNSDADIYMRYTLNTADRAHAVVTITAEKDGKTYSAVAGPHHESPYSYNNFSFDGTTDSNDGTLIFVLSNVVEDITSDTLNDYKWSVKIEDTKSDSIPVTVKNAEIVDLSTNRAVKAEGDFGFKLDGSASTLAFPEIEDYIPVTTTTAPATTEAPATTTTAEPTTTAPVTEPAETTAEVTTQTATEPETTSSVVTEPVIVTIPNETTSEATVTTSAQTEASTTQSATDTTDVSAMYIYGDTNDSGSISISDATLIQKYVAYIIGDDKLNLKNADTSGDGKISVKDATCIQKYLAKLEGFGSTGETYLVNPIQTYPTEATENITSAPFVTEPEETTAIPVYTTEAQTLTTTQAVVTTTTTEPCTQVPTETTDVAETTLSIPTTTTSPKPVQTQPQTQPPTQPSTQPTVKNEVTFTNSYGWQGTISCYYWSDSNNTMTSWPGVAMQSAGTNSFGEAIYTLQIPSDATYIIFTNGSIQTVDIPYSGGEQKFYPTTASNGKYSVANW